MPGDLVRWQARVTYLHDDGPREVVHDLHELFELHDLVETGAHWDTVVGITIVRVGALESPLTVEESHSI